VSGVAWRRDFAESPCFAGLAAPARHFSGFCDWPGLADLNQRAEQIGVVNALGLPVCFAAQTERHSQCGYEATIHATGQVPTRSADWHDFFNALIWMAWPRAKGMLNAVQHHALSMASGQRGPVSDAATLFDESGLVLVAADARLADLLRARQWRQAFWEARPAWAAARLYVFGHSLLEKSLQPMPGMTGKCLWLQADAKTLPDDRIPEWLDASVADAWEKGRIERPADLFPLPVWGVPGFDPANRSADFYANQRVFRPARLTPSGVST